MSLIHMEIINLNSYKILKKEDAINQTWDLIIIGSGIGGSVSALELSQFNLKILVIEKGPNSINSQQPQLWRKPIFDIVNNRSSTPFLGECLGGSSRLYGMAMEELHPDDFKDHGGKWPSSLNDWKPWYRKAEKIFNIHPANQMSMEKSINQKIYG